MMEELELYLDMLRGDLEVEVDLHGGRTEKSRTLRELIIYTERELAGLKSDRCSCVCGCSHVLSTHEMDSEGEWCGACYGEHGHKPTRGVRS